MDPPQGKFLLLPVLLWAASAAVTSALPGGFIAEVVTSQNAVTGTFAPNPRADGKPMLLLASRTQVSVVEDPDDSPDASTLLTLTDKMCTDTERGLQSIVAHPDFAQNRYIYLYYSLFKEGCLADDSEDGPWNVLDRFVMDSDTLLLDYDTREEIWRGAPLHDAVHNGGGMLFGNDGKLYVTTGDSGTKEFSQDLSTVHGSVIRLNDDGSIPSDNPFTTGNGYDAYDCRESGGRVPPEAADGAVCAEIYANGLRNPFRVAADPNVKDRTLFAISDVGARVWEELNYAGTDYAGVNYGYSTYEGPCLLASDSDCPVPDGGNFSDPFHYYLHREDNSGCVSGSAFVPEGIWPDGYTFLFADFVFLHIYNLIEDPDNECRTCSPPVSRFRNESFFESVAIPGDGKNEAKIIDLFFGPYNDTQALYVVKFGDYDSVLRIRYTGIDNVPPLVEFTVEDRQYDVGEAIQFDGTESSDPEGLALTYKWSFGDDGLSTEVSPTHVYAEPGVYTVTLFVVDSFGQVQQKSQRVAVGDPPSAVILAPLEGTEFSVGQVVTVEGEGFYANGTSMDTSQLVWEVRKHHDDHYHPFLDPINGSTLELPPAPEPEDFYAANNSYLEIMLTVADEYGLTATVSRLVLPKKFSIGIDSNPKGLDVYVDGEPVTSFQSIVSWQNHELHLVAEDQPPFVFTSWSDGVTERERSVKLNNTSDTVLVANFCTASGGGFCSEGSQCCSEICVEGSCVVSAPPTASPSATPAPAVDSVSPPTTSPSVPVAVETPPTPSDTESEVVGPPTTSPTSLRGADDDTTESTASSDEAARWRTVTFVLAPVLACLLLIIAYMLWKTYETHKQQQTAGLLTTKDSDPAMNVTDDSFAQVSSSEEGVPSRTPSEVAAIEMSWESNNNVSVTT